MPTRLLQIELLNFKTYGGKEIIGPLKSSWQFISVIGPNGSGKSNLLDAVSFAFGAKYSMLRASSLSDLIFRPENANAVPQKASVSVVLETDELGTRRFTRSIVKLKEQYSVDDETVTVTDYLRELRKLDINLKAKNFLVEQGMVESIAMRDKKERTSLFEEISGSKAYAREYEELRIKLNDIQASTQSAYSKKRNWRGEYCRTKQEKIEAEQYQQRKEQLAAAVHKLQMFKLFYNQKDIDNIKRSVLLQKSAMEEVENAKVLKEGELKRAKKLFGVESRELIKHENDISKFEQEVQDSKTPLIEIEEAIAHCYKKLKNGEASLKKAQDAHTNHSEILKNLREALGKLDKEYEDFQVQADQDNLSQGIDDELERSQVEEYNERKREYARRSASCQQSMEPKRRKQMSYQDRLDHAKTKYDETKSRIERKKEEREEEKKRHKKLENSLRECENKYEKLLEEKESLSVCFESSSRRMSSLQKELNEINVELDDAHDDTRQKKLDQTKHQAVMKLKQFTPGVFGRLKNLCSPSHQRYAVAITKVFGKNQVAIVVDSVRTASLCIEFLKQNLIEREIFLPLDNLVVKAFRDHWKPKLPPKCHLLSDCISFDPSVRKAVLYATKSTVVCESVEVARGVAYDLFPQKRIDAVALDGTHFKGGLISGGSADLARKAKHWNERRVEEMGLRRAELLENIRDVSKDLRLQSELRAVEPAIKGHEHRKKCIEELLATSETRIEKLQEDIEKLENELSSNKDEIRGLEEKVKEYNQSLEEMQRDLQILENEIFSEFCAKIGVPDLKAYEESGLRAYEDREEKRNRFENDRNRLQNQLEYESTRETAGNIKRWGKEMKQRKNELDSLRQAEVAQKERLEEATQAMDQCKKSLAEKKGKVEAREEDVKKVQMELKIVGESYHAAFKEILILESQLEELRRTRKSLLYKCHVENINIPLRSGDLDTFVRGQAGSSSGDSSAFSTTSSAVNNSETNSEIPEVNFDQLDDHLKELETDVNEQEDVLKQTIATLTAELNLLRTPNLRVGDQVEEACEKLRDSNLQFNSAREKAREIRNKFEEVKQLRFTAFMNCFQPACDEIDAVYKQLTQSTSASAFLIAENPEEPYLGGITYGCVVPGKSAASMSSLSGGEKTIASLTLLMALRKYHPAPFLILDEMDAALDTTNVNKVAHFFSRASFQTVAISLNADFYSHSDALIGVTRDGGQDKCKTYLFDLTKYGR